MPEVLIEIIVCIFAAGLAGLATGFAGLSAAVFITPFLVAFLKVPFFEAVGIALASDVFGSFISTVVFKRNGHINFKKSLPLFIPIILGCVGGSVASYFISVKPVGSDVMSYITMLGSLLLGLKFIIWPIREPKEHTHGNKRYTVIAILMGLGIGFICGFQGAGGGVMILFALTMVMSFEFKDAIGTSVLIMTFTAFIGATSHFTIGFLDNDALPSWVMLVTCLVSISVFAFIAAKIANKVNPVTLNRITGILLTISTIITLVVKILNIA